MSYQDGEFIGNLDIQDTTYYFQDMEDSANGEMQVDIEPGVDYTVSFDEASDFSIGSDTQFFAFEGVGIESININ